MGRDLCQDGQSFLPLYVGWPLVPEYCVMLFYARCVCGACLTAGPQAAVAVAWATRMASSTQALPPLPARGTPLTTTQLTSALSSVLKLFNAKNHHLPV